LSICGKMKRVRLNSKVRKACQGSSRGFSLIEVSIAIALIGVIAVAILSALSYASTVLIITDRQATAESLAKSQMEYVKNQQYIDYLEDGHDDYDLITVDGEGYELELVVVELVVDPDESKLQKVTVTVSYDIVRPENKVVEEQFILVGYKRQPIT